MVGRAHRHNAMLRYAEFIRIDDGKITDTAMFFDIPALMMGILATVQTGAQAYSALSLFMMLCL